RTLRGGGRRTIGDLDEDRRGADRTRASTAPRADRTTALSGAPVAMSVLYRRYRYNAVTPITPPVTAITVPPSPPMIRPSPIAAAPMPIIATLALSLRRASEIGRAGPGKLVATVLVKPARAMRGPAADAGLAVATGADVGVSET